MAEKININPEFKKLFLESEIPFAILGVGIPGSGKSAFLKKLANRVEAVYVHPGSLRNEEWAREKMRSGITAEDVIAGYIQRLFGDGDAVVIDSHHSRPELRAARNAMVRDAGVEVVAAVNFKVRLPYALEQLSIGRTQASEAQIRELYDKLKRHPVRYNEKPPFDLILDQYGIDGESVIRPFPPKK